MLSTRVCASFRQFHSSQSEVGVHSMLLFHTTLLTVSLFKGSNYYDLTWSVLMCSFEKNWPQAYLIGQFNLLAPCVLYIGQAFLWSPENAFYVFNQQIYFIIWYLLDRASLIKII